MPLQNTSGNDTTDAYGGGAAVITNYIENVFSTWLYTGNGTQQTIVNGIDLSTFGGMVWEKQRSLSSANYIIDTARGMNNVIYTNGTAAQFSVTGASANSNGYTSAIGWGSGNAEVGWTFRKQPKFFDIVTFTTDGSGNGTVTHNLGSTPGFIVLKQYDTSGQDWLCYHISQGGTKFGRLNTTAAFGNFGSTWITPSSTNFVLSGGLLSASSNYVAYIYASNAGGFGLTGTDNVISCGSYTSDGSGNATVTLGYEPQWVLIKKSSGVGTWYMFDTMRGYVNPGSSNQLEANTSAAEVSAGNIGYPTATGFQVSGLGSSADFIYIAIRRGPMKVPTDATKVFAPNLATSGSGNVTFTPNFVVDFNISKERYTGDSGPYAITRLLNQSLTTSDTSVAASNGNISFASNTSVQSIINNSSASEIGWSFQRAPSFFDIVCYTGTATAGQTYTHNLGVAPELMIIKSRSAARAWQVYSANLTTAYYLTLNSTNAQASDGGGGDWYGTAPTSTVFSVGTNFTVNNSGETYVAYLFATCAGVSKVGSYTGNGTTQTINCSFTTGARFVMIKRTDATGGWYVYDTARGMTTLTDPYSFMNSTAAEVATLGSVTTVSTGFALNSAILAAINVSGGTYIFLAIA